MRRHRARGIHARCARSLIAFAPIVLLVLAACAPATAPDAPRIATVHRSQCGRCHIPPEPRTRPREQVESAALRHAHRVRLTPEEWTAMIEYLAPAPN
jgi:hypothetical protein